MKLAALFSGGKDSSLAIHRSLERGLAVVKLVSIFPKSPESYMFHYPNIHLTELQSRAMEIPLVKKVSEGQKEKELKDLEGALNQIRRDIDGIVMGALASRYQRDRIKRICEKLNLSLEAPLWGEDPEKLWKEAIEKGFKIIIVSVACEGLGREWLGKLINREALSDLKNLSDKHKFHLSGEGGEFETLVLDAPFFKKKLMIKEGIVEWSEDSGFFHIRDAQLQQK
jgi:ABC transporter with metal-binding/Fe-S-binding domain ATP-binding protein